MHHFGPQGPNGIARLRHCIKVHVCGLFVQTGAMLRSAHFPIGVGSGITHANRQ
jgi:hypothetical protein